LLAEAVSLARPSYSYGAIAKHFKILEIPFLPRRRQDYPLHQGPPPHVIRKILEPAQTNQYQSALGRLVIHRKVALCIL
jgi:hypothetical protein